MSEAELLAEGHDVGTGADEDDVGQVVGKRHIGGGEGALLKTFGEDDALLVGLGALDDLLH